MDADPVTDANTNPDPTPTRASVAASPGDAPTATAITSPTIYVHYGTRHVKARIDHEVPLEEIIRQLTASSQLQISEPAALFALRVKETGQLVTKSNLHSLLLSSSNKNQKNVFTLCSSPTIEAVETIDKLSSASETPGGSGGGGGLKLATFSLKTLIKDRDFLTEFLKRDGFKVLQGVVERTSGNTLAYALNVVRDLTKMDDDAQDEDDVKGDFWKDFSSTFVEKLVEIVATQPLINISRPATSILVYLSRQGLDDGGDACAGFRKIRPYIVPWSEHEESHRLSKFLPNLISHLPQSNVATTHESLSSSSANPSNPSGGGVASTTARGNILDTESSELSLSLLESLLRGFVSSARSDAAQFETVADEALNLEQFRDELKRLGVPKVISTILSDAEKEINASQLTRTRNDFATSGAASNSTTLDSDSGEPPESSPPQLPLPSLVSRANDFVTTYHESLRVSYAIPTTDDDLSPLFHRLSSAMDDHTEESSKWSRMGWKSEDPTEEALQYWSTVAQGRASTPDQGGPAICREAMKHLVGWAGDSRLATVIREQEERSTSVTSPEHHKESARKSPRRIRIPYASFEITKFLAQAFELANLTPNSSSSSSKQARTPPVPSSLAKTPLVFDLDALHRILMDLWVRLSLPGAVDSGTISRDSEPRNDGGSHSKDEEATLDELGDKIKGLVEFEFRYAVSESGQETQTVDAAHSGSSGKKAKTIDEIERTIANSDYHSIRSRQLEELERSEGQFYTKKPIVRLKSRIYRECLEFVKQQRIDCLLEGIWVHSIASAHLTISPSTGSYQKPAWRFLRLSPHHETLHWISVVTTDEKEAIEEEARDRTGVDWFGAGSGKLDLSSITRITTSALLGRDTGVPEASEELLASPSNDPPVRNPAKLHRRSRSNLLTSSPSSRLSTFLPSSFQSQPAATSSVPDARDKTRSLPSSYYSVTLDLDPASPLSRITFSTESSTTMSELVDSLAFVLERAEEEGRTVPISGDVDVPTKETLDFVEQLSAVELEVKLLDLTGEGIEVPEGDDDDDESGQVDIEDEDDPALATGRHRGDSRGNGMVRSIPSDEDRFFYREFI